MRLVRGEPRSRAPAPPNAAYSARGDGDAPPRMRPIRPRAPGGVIRLPRAQVTNGPLFKTQFSLLRYKRGKRREAAVDRPFAAMHEHFVLVSRPPPWSRPRIAWSRHGRMVTSLVAGHVPGSRGHIPGSHGHVPESFVTSPDHAVTSRVAWSRPRVAYHVLGSRGHVPESLGRFLESRAHVPGWGSASLGRSGGGPNRNRPPPHSSPRPHRARPM